MRKVNDQALLHALDTTWSPELYEKNHSSSNIFQRSWSLGWHMVAPDAAQSAICRGFQAKEMNWTGEPVVQPQLVWAAEPWLYESKAQTLTVASQITLAASSLDVHMTQTMVNLLSADSEIITFQLSINPGRFWIITWHPHRLVV